MGSIRCVCIGCKSNEKVLDGGLRRGIYIFTMRLHAFDVAFSDIWAAGSMSLHHHQPMGDLSVCIAKSLEIAYFCSI